MLQNIADNSSQNSNVNYYTDNNQDHYRTRSGRKVVKPPYSFNCHVENNYIIFNYILNF